jgi:hypothetical protein
VRGDGAARLALSVPAGRYRATWLHPRTGARKSRKAWSGRQTRAICGWRCRRIGEDVALRLVRAPGGGR